MSIATEQQVIYSLLTENSLLQNCDLEPKEFQQWQNQEIYGAIREISDGGGIADLMTVIDRLSEKMPDHDFATYIAELVERGHGKSGFDQHCQIVRKDHRKRQALEIAQTMMDRIKSNQQEEAVDSAIQSLMALNTVGKNYDHGMLDVMRAATTMVSDAHEMDGIKGISTGLDDLNDTLGGFHKTDLVVIGARPAMGKAQPLTSNVLMADGQFKKMANIRLGDQVASPDGRNSVVEGIFPQGVRPIYAITLSDGRVVECDSEHLWTIECSRFAGRRTVTTADLMEMLKRERYRNRIRIVSHNGEFGNGEIPAIDPWLIGFLIGDGYLRGSCVRFSTGEKFILDKVASRIPSGCSIKSIEGCDYRIISESRLNPVLDALRAYGLNTHSYSKVIPDSLMRAGRRVRLELLLGLIESDGWSQSSSLQFSSSSQKLAEQVQALVRSLGGSASIRRKRNVSYVADGERVPARDAHICSICFDDMTSFIESERVRKNLGARRKTSQPIVRSIEYVRDDLAQCIKVTHPDSLYITDGYVVTHNTAFMLNLALAAKEPVGIISAEQGHEQIGLRMVSVDGKVDSQKLRTGGFYDDEWDTFSMAVRRLSDKPIRINDEPAISISKVIRQARDWKYKYGIKALYVDYLQKIEHSDKTQPRHIQVGEIARALKNLGRELDIPVIALAQVNRNCENRPRS